MTMQEKTLAERAERKEAHEATDSVLGDIHGLAHALDLFVFEHTDSSQESRALVGVVRSMLARFDELGRLRDVEWKAIVGEVEEAETQADA